MTILKFPCSPLELASELMKGPMCILFNTIFMTLHNRMKKNEFGYAVADSARLATKIWALRNDLEALLICDPYHRNAEQVFNAIILWRETQNKMMMRYLNKQNFCVSYTDVGRQSKKWENDILNGESSTTSLLKGVSTHSSIDNIDQESESTSLHFASSNLFQPNAEVSTGCPNDAAVCKSVENSHPCSNVEISPVLRWETERSAIIH